MERFGRDVIAMLDALGIEKTNWCGLSMGGMVGQWLGANAADRMEKLVLSNTHYYYSDKTPWQDRIKFVQDKGLEPTGRAPTCSAGSPKASAAARRDHAAR